jgi:mRNA-degrading endonuclease RelE of RelBE toxin-antitoxin system
MKMRKKNPFNVLGLTGLISIIFLMSCSEKEKKNSSELQKTAYSIAGAFINSLQKGDTGAINSLLQQNKNFDFRDSATRNLVSNFKTLQQISGEFVSSRLLREDTLGNDLGVFVYLLKYEQKCYRLTFVIYNNEKSIKLTRFSFDETIDVEMEERLKFCVK